MKSILYVVAFALLSITLIGCGEGGVGDSSTWSVSQNGNILEIAYGSGTDFPQYAALHLDSSYFRMNYGPDSGWGTSVILLPSFWEQGAYHQGAPVTCDWSVSGNDLLISISGTISQLQVQGTVRLSPPDVNSLHAQVTMTTTGSVQLDNRPGEAFKPVMLSSMHISDDSWDAASAYVESQDLAIPGSGWIIQPPVSGTTFGLKGGTSQWKVNAPTIEITLEQSMPITGWVTSSADPSDDNVGFWAASDTVLTSWQYTIIAESADAP